MAMTPKLWTISALAVELGRDRRTVAKALAEVAPDGKAGNHDAWRLANALDALGAWRGVTGQKSARDRKLEAEARMAEVTLAKEAQILIHKKAAEQAIFTRARAERDAWQQWPSRVAAQLAGEMEAKEGVVSRALEKAVREHLTELADTRFMGFDDA